MRYLKIGLFRFLWNCGSIGNVLAPGFYNWSVIFLFGNGFYEKGCVGSIGRRIFMDCIL